MKKILSFAMIAVMALAMTACSSVSYTARKNNVELKNLSTPKMEAGTRVDFTYRVSATSKAHHKMKDAKNDAIFQCIKNQHVDFVVDPIFEIDIENRFFFKEYTATVIGYAGYFTEATEKKCCPAPAPVPAPAVEAAPACCGHHEAPACHKGEKKCAKPAKKACKK